jgi:hypothetical protein
MRRDRSMLADAQRRFNAAAGEAEETPTPDPSPQGGGERAVPGEIMAKGRWCGRPPGEVELTLVTHEARALYECGVVPVREIARLCGVSVRTLYHHVQARGWRRRRSAVPRDGAKSARQRARYVAEKALRAPMPRGLKARDVDGQARALVAARRAAELAGEALAKAIARQDAEAQTRMLVMVARAMRDLAIAGGVVDVRGRQIAAKAAGEGRKRRRPYQWRPMYVLP